MFITIIGFLKEFLKKTKVSSVLPYIGIILLGYFYFVEKSNNANAAKEALSVFVAAQDSTSHKLDELGKKFSETSQIRSTDPNVFLKLKSNDEAVKRLQSEVNRVKGKLSTGSSVTQFSEDIHIDVPTTNGKYSDKWVSISTLPNRGVVDVKNEFTVNLLEDKGAYVAQIRNSNPYSKGIDSIKTYVKVPKPEGRWSVGVGGGYDGLSGKIAPMVGIQYKLFNLPF